MAFCLMALSHYLNQCWLIISGFHWDSSEGNFTNLFNKMTLKITYLIFFSNLPGANDLKVNIWYTQHNWVKICDLFLSQQKFVYCSITWEMSFSKCYTISYIRLNLSFSALTHWDRVSLCIIELGHHYFRYRNDTQPLYEPMVSLRSLQTNINDIWIKNVFPS